VWTFLKGKRGLAAGPVVLIGDQKRKSGSSNPIVVQVAQKMTLLRPRDVKRAQSATGK